MMLLQTFRGVDVGNEVMHTSDLLGGGIFGEEEKE
jgi:hypothetical protein